MLPKNVALFASGSGTNAENIVRTFRSMNYPIEFHILSNRKDAKVLARARKLNVPSLVFDDLKNPEGKLKAYLDQAQIDFIVLAGFLKKIPPYLVEAYPNKIINIHPALLPKFGGKGMYGSYVHEAVIQAKEIESGITIHYVNEYYDEGNIIFQARCPVTEVDTPETLAQKIHQLEYEHFPKVLAQLL